MTATPAGFLSLNGEIEKFVHLVHGLDVLSITQIHQSLYNPDLVRAALAGDPDSEVAVAAKVLNLDKVIASGPAPTVLLVGPARSATDLVTITTHVTDRGKGIEDGLLLACHGGASDQDRASGGDREHGPLERVEAGTVVAIAARVGSTRLIDNVILRG